MERLDITGTIEINDGEIVWIVTLKEFIRITGRKPHSYEKSYSRRGTFVLSMNSIFPVTYGQEIHASFTLADEREENQ